MNKNSWKWYLNDIKSVQKNAPSVFSCFSCGGGLHGKDLSKADVTLNIYAHLKAQETGEPVELTCAIGDEWVDGKPYSEIVEIARDYIKSKGGFEKFAEWGFV